MDTKLMSGLVIIGIILVVYLVMKVRDVREQKQEKDSTDSKDSVSRKTAKADEEIQRIKEEKIKAGSAVYSYINSLIKQMMNRYQQNQWDAFDTYQVSDAVSKKDFNLAMENLGAKEKTLLSDILQCVALDENRVTDSVRLKVVLEQMVLPFYPVYHSVFGQEIRYSAFLNRTTLNLFHQLSGKKFRVGYRNKYKNGVTAFNWKNDVYQVFDRDGRMICDASFKNGKVYNGFGVEFLEESAGSDWELERAGTFQDGVFQDGELVYRYKKPCQ